MNRRFRLLLALSLLALTARPAGAHFLFVRILPPAEGGRAAEVYFSELAEAGDSRFIDKIAHTKLWAQTIPGTFEPLRVHKAPDRLRAFLPAGGGAVVVGECVYGVLARAKQTPFLLRHFPKAVAGSPDEVNRMKPHGKLPLEVVAAVEGEQIRFTVLKDGKAVPKAQFVTVDAKLNNVTLTADEKGLASWKPPRPGVYSVYTRDTRKESGEAGGKKYEEIRDFATVAFSWPLQRTGSDPEAVALFEDAMTARAKWQDFPGFKARAEGNLDGRRFSGTVTIDNRGEVLFSDDDSDREESVGGWVQDQLASIVLHRIVRKSAAERPKPVLRFAEANDDHPLGRLLIFEGGRFASSYRVKDRQIMVVNRNLDKENMTITVLDNDSNADGQFVPRSYLVHYWDAESARLLRTESVQDRWKRVGTWDLPALHTVTTTGDAGTSVRTFTLSGHELLKK